MYVITSKKRQTTNISILYSFFLKLKQCRLNPVSCRLCFKEYLKGPQQPDGAPTAGGEPKCADAYFMFWGVIMFVCRYKLQALRRGLSSGGAEGDEEGGKGKEGEEAK